MIVKAYPPQMTPEQFEELRDAQGLELIDGVVQEKNMGTENGAIQTRISYHLNSVVLPTNLGFVLDTEAMFRCFPRNPNTVRKPDVSFILRDRLTDGLVPRGICTVRPDLAVEVVSPNDMYEEVEEKIADYLDTKIPLFWIVTPLTRSVLVYRDDGTARRLCDADDLTADSIIPNFRVRVADLFPNPPGAFEKPNKKPPKATNL